MIYLDNGATSFPKPEGVVRAVAETLRTCANPGRGGYGEAIRASRKVYECRELAGKLFSCPPEQVVMTASCTHGLNTAIRSLFRPGDRVVISGFEHNAVTRPLYALGTETVVAGRKLFDWEDTLTRFEDALRRGAKGAVFTHVSNVFGYILPAEELAWLCRQYRVPFAVDAAQSAGILPVDFARWGADFVAMPGHKGLLGPQGTGILLCNRDGIPLLQGGTGSLSASQEMPDFLPDRLEPGTLNVPGIAGLTEGMRYVNRVGTDALFRRANTQLLRCAAGLEALGLQVFSGPHQASTVSFCPDMDCEELAQALARRGIALRAGLHCAPLAHESAGTLAAGTVRISFGHDANRQQTDRLLQALSKVLRGKMEKF